MVVQVQYEALGNSQVAVPDLLAAYAQGKEIKNRQKQYDLANRQGEMSLKKQEMELPYYEDNLKQDKQMRANLIEQHGMNKVKTWLEFGNNFLVNSANFEEFSGNLKAMQDILGMPDDVVKMVVSQVPEDAIGNQEKWQKSMERLRYGNLLFAHELGLKELDYKNSLDVSSNEAKYKNDERLLDKEIASRERIANMRGSGSGGYGTPSILGKLYREQSQYDPGTDEWNTYQEKIDSYSGGGSGGGSISGVKMGNIPISQLPAFHKEYMAAKVNEVGEVIDKRTFKQWMKEEIGIDLDAGSNGTQNYQAEDIFAQIQKRNLSPEQIDAVFEDLKSRGQMDTFYQLDSMVKDWEKTKSGDANKPLSGDTTRTSSVDIDPQEDLSDKAMSTLSESIDFKYKPGEKNAADELIKFITFLTGKAGKDVGGILKAAAENLPEAQEWLRRNVIYPLQRFGQNPGKVTKQTLEELDRYAGGGK